MPTGPLFGGEPQGVVRRTSWYWADSVRIGICRGPNCHQTITFVTNANTGKVQPFSGKPRPMATEMRPGERGRMRQAMELDLAEAHHSTCVDADFFRRQASRRR